MFSFPHLDGNSRILQYTINHYEYTVYRILRRTWFGVQTGGLICYIIVYYILFNCCWSSSVRLVSNHLSTFHFTAERSWYILMPGLAASLRHLAFDCDVARCCNRSTVCRNILTEACQDGLVAVRNSEIERLWWLWFRLLNHGSWFCRCLFSEKTMDNVALYWVLWIFMEHIWSVQADQQIFLWLSVAFGIAWLICACWLNLILISLHRFAPESPQWWIKQIANRVQSYVCK